MHEYDDGTDEITLLDIFNIIWKGKRIIILCTILCAVLASVYAFTRVPMYEAVCRIMPQGGGGGGPSLGGLADFFGVSFRSASGISVIGILESDTFADAMIDRFNLMEKFSSDIRVNVRAAVHGLVKAESPKTGGGIITISVTNKDPEFAAEFANASVEEIQKRLQEISNESAIQRRAFFENQLIQAQKELNEAEDAIIKYQQSRGVIAFEAQTQALVSSMTSLRNQIAAKNVEISTMKSYAREDNPNLKLARSQLEAMTKELRRLEEEQKKIDASTKMKSRNNNDSGHVDSLSSIGELPEMGIEYQRYLRSLRFSTAKYESMLRQYESARLTEANDLSTISIIDYATVPDYPTGRKPRTYIMLGTLGGIAVGIFFAFIAEHLKAAYKIQKRREAREELEDDEWED